MKNKAENEKKLAEKVAEMLDKNYFITGSDNIYLMRRSINPSWANFCCNSSYFDPFFSWPTVGLCIDKAELMGWSHNQIADQHSFKRFDDADFNHTSLYMGNEHGHIEAIIRAFAEISIEGEI